MTTNQHLKTLSVLLALGGTSMVSQGAWINELHYDNVGADSGEFVEIAGPAGTDLTGWRILLFNGSNGTVYDTISLDGTLGDSAAGFGFLAFNTPAIQNGSPDGLALIDIGDNVIQFLSYEGAITAVGGVADGLLSVDIGVEESGSTPVGYSLQLGGVGSSYSDFTWQSPSPSTSARANHNQSFATAAATVPDSGTSLAMLAMVAGMIPFAVRYSRR